MSRSSAAATPSRIGDPALATRLAGALEGEVLFDRFSRGRYATDASIYQIEPLGVVVPRSRDDLAASIAIAAEQGVSLLARGGGTSQCGQTVAEAIVVDVSKHLDRILDFDPAARRITVEPGLVLDRLNAFLRPHGLMFPVDVSTSSRATLGGMAGNNSCGARSLAYGTMRDNVRAIAGILADGTQMHFGEINGASQDGRAKALTGTLLALGRREAGEIAARFPKLMRRVGGYNIDALVPGLAVPRHGRGARGRVQPVESVPISRLVSGGTPLTNSRNSVPAGNAPANLAHLLVGSEGTLAVSAALELELQPLPTHKVLGVCHFPSFCQAMDSARHIVALGPTAVELVDRTMVELARDIPLFRRTLSEFVRGEPAALLLVEFAGEDHAAQLGKLKDLGDLMGSLGFPGAIVEAIDPAFQKAVWEVRKAGLNIMMSMKGDGKPVSFIEDCAVALEDLADYTERLTRVFEKHGTTGTWYAHASVGCLHVRPVLNLKLEADAIKMRAIAEEAFAMVRDYKGSHSGEHGDGLVRSEFHEPMFGARMVGAFREVKHAFDPAGTFNPGKIVDPPKMDDRSLFRFKPGYRTEALETALDWSPWGGFAGAVEMCNNNGACRKFDAGVMCPSFRVTRDEQHLTRGRANTLRLALSGQLDAEALTAPAMAETMKLCVGCKACKRECPTGVDMARMKTEFLHHYTRRHGLSLRDRLVAYLPRYAPWAARLAPLLNLRDRVPGLAELSEMLFGVSAQRSLPRWRRPFSAPESVGPEDGREVVLFADTFNRAFEPENLRAALAVLTAAGYRVHLPRPLGGGRPLCCGRTFLAAGLVDEARVELRRTLAAIEPFLARGVPLVGLEPSCLLTFRDEAQAILPEAETTGLAESARLFEEFLTAEQAAGRLALDFIDAGGRKALLHGHCHQKAFDAMGAVEAALRLVPGLEVETVTSSCCGMAGAFGYQAETYDASMAMAEFSLLPAVRATDAGGLIVAGGTSCRHQIADGGGREAQHVARVLADALTKED